MAAPTKDVALFRDYTLTPQTKAIAEHYKKMRTKQTVDYVRRMKAKYLTFSRPMFVWDAMEQLNALVDVSVGIAPTEQKRQKRKKKIILFFFFFTKGPGHCIAKHASSVANRRSSS